MFGLTVIDMVVIILYFSVIIFIGYRAMKHIRNEEDYFLGGRRFGKMIQTFASFGQGTSSENAVGMTTMVNTNGASGIWGSLAGLLFSMPIYWMTCVWYRRMRLLTLADFFEDRFGSKSMAGFYAIIQAVFFMIAAALGFTAMSKTVAGITVKPLTVLSVEERAERSKAMKLDELESLDFELLSASQKEKLELLRLENPRKEFSYVNEQLIVIIVSIIVFFYAAAGGLEAAFITDMIQGIFIIILSVILIPLGLMKINRLNGGTGFLRPFEIMHEKLPEAFFEIWGSPNVIEFTWYWIVAVGLIGVINVGVQANQLTACGSAKDEYTARFGFVAGVLIKRYSMVFWGLLGLITLVLYSGVVRNPDYIWGYAARDLLGPMGVGLVGLMIACLMAALMSTADCLMITTSGLLTKNVYQPLVPGKSQKHYVQIGRLFSAFYIIGGILIATQFKSIFVMIKLIFTFNCILAASFWLGMLWRRATVYGAWFSIIITFLITAFSPVIIPLVPGVRTGEYFLQTTHPSPIVRRYIASENDVDQRQSNIEKWDRLNEAGIAKNSRPEPLQIGQKFPKTFNLPNKSVFWGQGLEIQDNQIRGCGMLKVELVMIDLLGFDLSENSYSLNETISILFKIIVPFGVIIIVSLLTRPDDKKRLDLFYVKMKTPVEIDRDEDARQMALSYENPSRFDNKKLFANSNWELTKWDRTDWFGVMWILVGIASVIGLMVLLVNLGG